MAKTHTIDFRKFMAREEIPPSMPIKIVRISASLFMVMAPRTAMAATADATFGNVMGAVMNIVDWIVVGVFIFAGVSWMFGHRGKALELIIGGAAGYILARHAVDIRDFLKTI
jgi:hypothetical protein